ncbi:hypothetical protein ACFONG_18225 [Uliginosibacterium paludis]|uniref:Uncharacterized protein n=1 Tax=Uliginosibacterium paludis TaxID=1615952 RepID=A0ABV2CRY9_9RHOO
MAFVAEAAVTTIVTEAALRPGITVAGRAAVVATLRATVDKTAGRALAVTAWRTIFAWAAFVEIASSRAAEFFARQAFAKAAPFAFGPWCKAAAIFTAWGIATLAIGARRALAEAFTARALVPETAIRLIAETFPRGAITGAARATIAEAAGLAIPAGRPLITVAAFAEATLPVRTAFAVAETAAGALVETAPGTGRTLFPRLTFGGLGRSRLA